MDGANVCRQKEVRLQHYPVGHHHRRRPPRARLFRARQAPLSSRNTTTRRGAFWRFVVRPTHDGDRKLARAQESPQRKQKTDPTDSNSVCLSSCCLACQKARRRALGLRPEFWLQGQWRPSYTSVCDSCCELFLSPAIVGCPRRPRAQAIGAEMFVPRTGLRTAFTLSREAQLCRPLYRRSRRRGGGGVCGQSPLPPRVDP